MAIGQREDEVEKEHNTETKDTKGGKKSVEIKTLQKVQEQATFETNKLNDKENICKTIQNGSTIAKQNPAGQIQKEKERRTKSEVTEASSSANDIQKCVHTQQQRLQQNHSTDKSVMLESEKNS